MTKKGEKKSKKMWELWKEKMRFLSQYAHPAK